MNPLSWADIDGWANRRRVDPLDWELDTIKALDITFLTFHAEK